jgi:hypothetical protein
MGDVLDVYCRSYDPRYPVVCLDESSKGLGADVHVPLPMEPGKPERIDDHYQRQGTANVFLACEPLRGWRGTKITKRRTKVDWVHFVQELVAVHYPEAVRSTLSLALYWQGELMHGQNLFRRLVLEHFMPQIDGRPVEPPSGRVCQAPLYIRLSDEVGDWAGNIADAKLPDAFLVDYVRVYDAVEGE